MTVSQFVEQWTQQAAHDLDAARLNREYGFYDTSIVLCQQSVEKYLKALWAHRHTATPPRTHELTQLAGTMGVPSNLMAGVGELSNEYLPARYPDVAGMAPYTKYSEAEADRHLHVAEEIQQWVQAQLSSSTP
jgi:HEPN domain-containing protein